MSRLLAVIVATVAALCAAAPAQATWTWTSGGHAGNVSGSASWVRCVQFNGTLWDAAPFVSRANAYRTSTQTIYKRTRLERLVGSRYVVEAQSRWAGVNVRPGQEARFPEQPFAVYTDGIYRISYQLRWYVGNRQIGHRTVYHHANEIEVNGMEGQRIIGNGCTMDVGNVVIG